MKIHLNKNKYRITDIILFDDVRYIDLYNDDDLDGGFVTEALSNKIIFDKSDIIQVLDQLKQCDNIHLEDYYKTNKFLRKNGLTPNDCLDIIHNLTISDYIGNVESINPDHKGNNLIIFEPKDIKVNDNNIIVYMKIDYDETTSDTVALVSIHQADKQNKVPYQI